MYNVLLRELKEKNIRLVAVSKTHPPEKIMELYQLGQRDFGENRVQEMVEKAELLPKDIRWHLIGHLQTNKVKYIASFVHLIHGIDSEKLLREIDRQAQKADRVIDGLLQFHIAQEETKFGFDEAEAREMLVALQEKPAPHVRLKGVMGMASFTDNEQQVYSEFESLSGIFNRLKADFFSQSPDFCELSMGMSADWRIAAACGSTMVRIGSLIFGSRPS